MQKTFTKTGSYKVMTWITFLAVCLLILGQAFNVPSRDVEVTAPAVDVPTAAEIAALVEIPEINVPETETEGIDNSKLDALYKINFGECYNSLEDDAKLAVFNEIDEDEMEEFIEDNVVNFDSLEYFEIDDEETEVTISEIGYCVINDVEFGDEDDNKVAIVNLVYDFEYENTEDNTEYKGQLLVTANVEFDEGDFNDEDIDFEYLIA